MIKYLVSLLFLVLFAACGKDISGIPQSNILPDLGSFDPNSGVVVRSRSLIEVKAGDAGATSAVHQAIQMRTISSMRLSATDPITVVNSPSSSLVLSNSLFSVPTITSDVLDFGYLQISSLQDNHLEVCGTSGNQKCNTALIRMYTTGTAGSGLYNSDGGYGAPIKAGQTTLSSIGLNVAGAAILQSISIASSKHVIHLSDFVNPKYNVQIDFSNAGAGSYSTTLVIEYALSL